jgi:hypothetical protein
MNCYICNKKAIGRLSPDLDINGIGYCLKHKTILHGAYIALMNGNNKIFEQLTGKKIN